MMSQAFYTGLSGLKNNSTGIDVVSNNIANISTTGYRGYTAEFSSLFEDAISTGKANAGSVGGGVQVQATSMMKNQGTLALSDKSTDVAIRGNGWFGIRQDGQPVYTRDGSFTFDANNDLVTVDGYHVLGTIGGNISKDDTLKFKINEISLGDIGAQQKLRFPKSLSYPPEATSNVKFIGNIGVGTEPYKIGATVVDTQNNKNQLSVEFVKKADQVLPGSQYTLTATVSSADGSVVHDTKVGEVKFDGAGKFISSDVTTIDNNGTPISINFGKGFDGITAIDLPYAAGSSIADGTVGGELAGYQVNRNAEVIATFTNGEQSSVGKIAVYHFANEQGLDRVNGTRFSTSSNSGAASFYKDASGKNINGAEVLNFQLENSNIELSYGLTELIILQRAYDANSKSITTADQMVQKALNMAAK